MSSGLSPADKAEFASELYGHLAKAGEIAGRLADAGEQDAATIRAHVRRARELASDLNDGARLAAIAANRQRR